MKRYIKNHWFEYVVSFLLVVFMAMGISLVFGYAFSTNDDAMLRNIINGNYTGTPDAHMVYIMYPLGFIWKCMYQMMPNVPWYDVFMVGMHYLCWYMILLRIMQQFERKAEKLLAAILAAAVLIIIDLPYLVMHQYTVLAAILAAVAIFWLITSRAETKAGYWVDRSICIIFLCCCLWLRKQVFFMALPIGLFILLKEFGSTDKNIKKSILFKRLGLFLGIVVAIVTFSFVVEGIAYRDEEWKDFKIYNDARTDIYDYYGVPAYEEYAQAYEEIDISYGDWIVIDRYDSGLVNSLTTDKMLEMAQWSIDKKEESQQYYSVFRQGLYSVCNEIFYNSVQPAGLCLCILYVVALLYAYRRGDKNGFLCLCGLLVFQALFVGYFILQGRFPERISYGLYFMQICYLAGFLLGGVKDKLYILRKDKFWCVALVAVLLIILASVGLYRVRMTINESNDIKASATDWKYVNEYFLQNADKKYCIVTKSFVFSTELMFDEEKVESDNVIRLGSWIQHSPLEAAHNSKLGVTEIGESILQDEQVYLVESAENDLWWLDGYLESQDAEKEIEIVDEIVTPGGRTFFVIAIN